MNIGTGIPVDFRGVPSHEHGEAKSWPTKHAAVAALAVLRECGLNRDREIEAHQAEDWLFRFWVIGRPDHHNGITYLMTEAGAWVAGRLFDASPCFCTGRCTGGHGARWRRLQSIDVCPATVTHDYTYSAGSVAVCGHDGKPLMSAGSVFGGAPTEILSWHAFAWCVACTWKTNGSDEASVRAGARWHRANPEQYPGHATPRRSPGRAGTR